MVGKSKKKTVKKKVPKKKTVKTTESKHGIIHNTININNNESTSKPRRRTTKSKPKTTPKDLSAYFKPENRPNLVTIGVPQSYENPQYDYQVLELARRLHRSNNPDRFGEQQNLGLTYPTTYNQVHSQQTPAVQPVANEPVVNEQVKDKPVEKIASYPYIHGSATQLAKLIIAKYGDTSGDVNDRVVTYVDDDGKRWTQTALRNMGVNGLRKFIHENNMTIDPTQELPKKKTKAEHKKELELFNNLESVSQKSSSVTTEEDLISKVKSTKKKTEKIIDNANNLKASAFAETNAKRRAIKKLSSYKKKATDTTDKASEPTAVSTNFLNMTKKEKIDLLFERKAINGRVNNWTKNTFMKKTNHKQINEMLKT